jgi:hypothetical protein
LKKFIIETSDSQFQTEADYYEISNGVITFYEHGILKDEVVSFFNMQYVIGVFADDLEEDE